ncbi:KH domain-containing protein [Candidatus Saganbacteria bacterium]|nr:KH domain-containing protein [Candidatus Saganbacteria bacterium]
MKELVEYIVRSLVEFPDQISITETPGDKLAIIEVRVAEADMGKVIGKEGKIANAIRTVAKAAAGKEQIRVNVEFISKSA